MRVTFATAVALTLLIPCTAFAGAPTPEDSRLDWVQIADGVFEAKQEGGGRLLRFVGEEGIRWNVSRYEALLDSLRGEDGIIAPTNSERAKRLMDRLHGLHELLRSESDIPYSCVDTPSTDSGSDDCGNETYTWSLYACAKYGTLLYGYSPYATATASCADCPNGWEAKVETYVYRYSPGGAGEETDSDDDGWGRSVSTSSVLSFGSSSTTCLYAWSRASVTDGSLFIDVIEADQDKPNGCCAEYTCF